MSVILGWICLVLLIGLLAPAVTRKFGLRKANAFLIKIHKPLAVAFLLICVVHTFFVLPLFRTRTLWLYVTGFVMVLLALLLIILCHIMKKEKKQKICWHRILSVVMLLLAIGHMVVYYVDYNQYKESINNIRVEGVDISTIPDGTYYGEYDAGYVYAQVEVRIADGQMTEIRLVKHRNERGKPGEQVLTEMITQQSIKVDAISGATNSSNVIKQAVENALLTAN